jgi:cytochrome c551
MRRMKIDDGPLTMDHGLLLLFLVLVIVSCSSKSETTDNASVKFKQYYIQGEKLYVQHCSNCHQKNGKGLGLVYPPLDTSDYMTNRFTEVLCLMRYGKMGAIEVNRKVFNQPMQGIPTLTDLEIAEIATYIYNTWSHGRGIVEVKAAQAALATCSTTLNK